jgi:hypothetical protein
VQPKSILPLAFFFFGATLAQANGQVTSVTIDTPNPMFPVAPFAPVTVSGFAGWSGFFTVAPPSSVDLEITGPNNSLTRSRSIPPVCLMEV